MSLNKQIHIYSLDTSCFYNENELKIHNHMYKRYRFKTRLHKLLNDKNLDGDALDVVNKHITSNNKGIKNLKEKLYAEFKLQTGARTVASEAFSDRNIISVFESSLTRIIGIPDDTLSRDIIIVQTYFFDVIEDIILDGFICDGEKYVCLTASAGQIRTKKTVFIKESVLLKCQMTLMCGLTIDKINSLGGVNINKYLAYLALSNSATDLWSNFNINKSIVVDDMETNVRGLVDFIDDETYEITRQEMDVLINHTDGCGMILPKLSKKSMMVRLPWVKGLLVSFPFDKFIKEANKQTPEINHALVTDIYGVEHDVIKESIEVIFTKSQFKMYKYYSSWKEYVDNFVQFKCQAGKCNEEEDKFGYAKINYQMLQTLTDMTDEELETIAKKTKNNIINIGSSKETMLRVLGVVESNINKNYIQQALDIYPELLKDTYSRDILRAVKKSMVKEGRAGKLDINGKYTFICPDLYAFCEYLFLKDMNPKGLLKDGEVFCELYSEVEKLDCLRSPHLYREHAVRSNVVDEEKKKWFITKGLYTSCHDMISKILMFDVDGDKALVCADQTIVKVAERNMIGIVPLFYNMRKAKAETINSQTIYNGLKTAYTGGNIGMYSNDISKIWNSGNVNLDAIKLLCMENNFVIDMAKTLYKPVRPESKKNMITDYTKLKTPHFFIYAKDKEKDQVEKVNNSVVNRLEKNIPNPNIKFSATNLGTFNYKTLMSVKRLEADDTKDAIIQRYTELDQKSHFMINRTSDDGLGNISFLYNEIRNSILEVNPDLDYVVNVLVDYLYVRKKSNYKTTLWECFGDVIVENIKRNVENTIPCEMCGERIEEINNKVKYCPKCAKKVKLENDRRIQKERYKARKQK